MIEDSLKNMSSLTNSGLEQVKFKKGEFIYKYSEIPKFAYYVYTGTVNIISESDYILGKVNEGELFGDISAVFNKGHTVSAQASCDSRILIIEKELFYKRVSQSDPVIKAIIRTLSSRLSDMNERSEKLWKEVHFLSSIKKKNISK